MSIQNLIGLGFLLLFSVILLIVNFLYQRRDQLSWRSIPALGYLRRLIGLSVEEGKRIHLTLGWGNLFEEPFSSGLIGLNILDRLGRVALFSDHPPIATSGRAELSLMSQDVLSHSAQMFGLENLNKFYQGQLIGITPYSYAAAAQSISSEEKVAVDLYLGHFSNESGLMLDTSERNGDVSIAGSEDLTAQAIFFGAANFPLIGEEVYAAGAYLGSNTMHKASLRVQDYFRWAIILVILGGILLKIAGVI
ncbi:MAG: DUF6754 domain-containing protein [Anaerolineales bacterium]